MSKIKLNQALAAEGQYKARAAEAVKWYTGGIRSFVMNGFIRSYEPRHEEGDQVKPEESLVQATASGVMTEMVRYYAPFVDAVGTKDYGNIIAKVDVVVDGAVICERASVPFLLFLEKTIGEFRQFINALPQRDRARRWEGAGPVKDSPVEEKLRTVKTQVPIELAPATKEHKAQVQLVSKDGWIGTWQTVHKSGAASQEEKEALLGRCDKLLHAVRAARELANTTEVETVEVAGRLFGYLFE